MSVIPDTKLCRHCGEINPASRSLCQNCQSPLTAYAADLHAQESPEIHVRNAKIDALGTVPQGAIAAVAFDVFFAIFWPFALVMASILARPHINSDGTNYIGTAFGALGPIFTAIIFLPVGLALLVVAAYTYMQRPWAWSANVAIAALFALKALAPFKPVSILWLLVAGVVLWMLYRRDTRLWFGHYV